jgi:glycerol-3-phosphate acyltransferase PlsY
MQWIESLRSANWNQASFFCVIAAYGLGCLTSGYYLVRFLAGKDIREIGSGSVGARNVSRVLGKTGFLLTLLFDFGKGALAIWAARHYTTNEHVIAFVMLAVVIGHIWPAQLRFHGGKGMATSLGALLVYDPQVAMTFVILFFCLFAWLRRTVLPALFALSCLPLTAMLLDRGPAEDTFLLCLAALVLVAHRKNLMEEFSILAARRHPQPESDQPHL